jgi:hypothetical protein
VQESHFTHLNPGFTCEVCAAEVLPAQSSCRNHCPQCLHSKHVDIYPGDRANSCQGIMKAVSYKLNAKKGLVLIFRCLRCGEVSSNKAAYEDKNQADVYEKILALSAIS